MKYVLVVFQLIIVVSCNPNQKAPTVNMAVKAATFADRSFDSSKKVIHVLVALCDNKYQGIVPVPPGIGNGQDANANLYWGCSYGVRSFFKKSRNWKLLKQVKTDNVRLERLIFKHLTSNYYLVADAYDGRFIKQCTVDFLQSCSGQLNDVVTVDNTTIGINGNAKLLAYIGHDGLMDFTLQQQFINAGNNQRDAIILACISKKYFGPHLAATKANPLLWTTGLMAPEAYTLHDALEQYIPGHPPAQVQTAAAKAYAKYQRCSEKAAGKLLVTGW